MATPKKRTGKAKQNARRANWKGSAPATTICPNCKEIVLTHTVCPACGYYKDGFASIKAEKAEVKEEVKAEAVVEEVKEEKEVKKTRKPRAKKAAEEKAEEVKEEKAEVTEEAEQ